MLDSSQSGKAVFLVVAVTWAELFREPVDERALLDSIRGVDVKDVIAFASTLCLNFSITTQMGGGIEEWVRNQPALVRTLASPRLADQILARASSRRAYRNRPWVIFDPVQALLLVRAALRVSPEAPTTWGSPRPSDALVKACLVLNDLVWGRKTEEHNMAGRFVILEELSTRPHVTRPLQRWHKLLFDSLLPLLPNAALDFKARFGAKPKEYFLALLALNYHVLAHRPFGPFKLEAETFDNAPGFAVALHAVLEHCALTPSTIRSQCQTGTLIQLDLRPFRDFPLLRYGEDTIACLDPYLLVNRACAGLFWDIVSCYPQGSSEREEVLARMGEAFSQYVANMMKDAADDRALISPGDQRKDEITDVVVVEDGAAIVIESKANLMKAEAKWSDDTETIRQLTRERILKNEQVSRALARLTSNREVFCKLQLHQVKRLFPIIVVHDSAFWSPLAEKMVNDELRLQLEHFEVDKVHLLTAEDLEASVPYVRKGCFGRLLALKRKVDPQGVFGLFGFLHWHKAAIKNDLGFFLEFGEVWRTGMEEVLGELMARLSQSPPRASASAPPPEG